MMFINPSISHFFKKARYAFLILLCLSCNNKEEVKRFISLSSEETQIDFENTLTITPELNILNYLYYYNGSGVSVGDFNNDGLKDLYFTANQTKDRLYINKGNFKFEDVTAASSINNAENWTTSSTTVDINNDGLLDIYVCKIGDYNTINGQNLLYVNQGPVNGVPTFKEEAELYNLNIKSFATQSVFFDYDQDEDLDMFLLNHSVHPNRNYGRGLLRTKKDTLSGDRLYRNDNGRFVDVSEEAGIFQGKIGYGLGVSVGDINNDGFPDLYVGNDFFENDYLYINQGNGTFKDIISTDQNKLGHTSHFSMGNAINDINNDGLPDIISLDMLPEDLATYKSSGLEYPYPIYQNYLKNGYKPQFMQNTLHINRGNSNFMETAYLSGLAATEWSWSPSVADFDNDGYKDIYITNGILGATNDMDFINFISNEEIQKKLGVTMKERDLDFIDKMPQKKVSNYLFMNNGNNTFQDVSSSWSNPSESYSNGSAYADLDNDGDLDIIVNNINSKAFIIRNTSEQLGPNNRFLAVTFKGPKPNILGIGTKVIAYHDSEIISAENYTTNGYLSSVAARVNLGFGKTKTIDSLHIVWPGGKYQTLTQVNTNQLITAHYSEALGNFYGNYEKTNQSFLTNTTPLFKYKHEDQASIEFNRDPLIPYSKTNTGPNISVADINNDGLDDVFIGGGKLQPGTLFIQTENGEFQSVQKSLFEKTTINEDTDNIVFDANGDTFLDLLVVSGGNEFRKGKPLKPRLFINKNGVFSQDTLQFKTVETNASKVKAVDIDNDGDKDISIMSNLMPWQFGKTPKQYLFKNDGNGSFSEETSSISSTFQDIGNVEDIVWVDINNDNYKDAIVAGHWMPIQVFLNDGKTLTLQKNNNLKNTHGWWNTIEVADFDQDGDLDIIAGNWGTNTRLKASIKEPVTLYNSDFDNNGKIDPLVTYFHNGQETPFASKDQLVAQLPFLNKKFLSYQEFAKADLNDLFTKNKLNKATKKYVYELASCYFENLGDNSFKKHQLPIMSQVSSVNDIVLDDYNNDGFLDVFLVGNNYEISTQLGKLDASHGKILLNNKQGFFKDHVNPNFDVYGPARSIKNIIVNDTAYHIISINNHSPIFLKKEN